MNGKPVPHEDADDAEVIHMADRVRARGRSGDGEPASSWTLILQISHVRTDAEAHRHVGVDDALRLRDLQHVIAVSFALGDEEQAPWNFSAAGERLDRDDPLHLHLGVAGDRIVYVWGLWEFSVTVVDSWVRDENTPRALCVGGSGAFGRTPFNINEINAELTGEQAIETVLAGTTEPVRELIERGRLYDFVPLLQALDLDRDTDLPPDVRRRLAPLPYERDAAGRDAFWSKTLSLASLTAPGPADHILESTMAALGWVEDDGSRLTADAIRRLCFDSWQVLVSLGAAGSEVLSPVDRLDIYRELLRSDRPKE